MKIVPNLVNEFEELCSWYEAVDQEGKDIVTLVKMFGDKCDSFWLGTEPDFATAWDEFLEEHKHQVTVTMVGVIIYVLVTYWELGHVFFEALPTLEKMLLADTVQQISEEIDRRSAANGNAVVVPE